MTILFALWSPHTTCSSVAPSKPSRCSSRAPLGLLGDQEYKLLGGTVQRGRKWHSDLWVTLLLRSPEPQNSQPCRGLAHALCSRESCSLAAKTLYFFQLCKPEAAAGVSWQFLSVCVPRPPADLPRPLRIVSGLQNWLEIQAACLETASKGSRVCIPYLKHAEIRNSFSGCPLKPWLDSHGAASSSW